MHRLDVAYCYTRHTFHGLCVCLCARQRALYKTDEPIVSRFGKPTLVGPRNHVLDGVHMDSTWRSVRGGDADLRQVTLTIFSVPTLTRSRNYC